MSKAKVCMLCANHAPLDARIFHKEAVSLQQGGYDVTVIAPLSENGSFVDAGGNIVADGEFTLNNVRIAGFNKGRRLTPKIHALLRFATLTGLPRFKLKLETFADLTEKGLKLNADVYHCHEVWSLYSGIQIKKRLEEKGEHPKLIYDVHEYLPVYIRPNILSQLFGWVLSKAIVHFTKKALKYVDYVITANQITRGYLLTLNRFLQTEVIYNCSSLEIFHEPERSEKDKDKLVICHEGALNFGRGLKTMIEVMRLFKERYGNKVELLIVGDIFDGQGGERRYFREKIEEYGLHDSIRCTGWLPYERVGEAVSQADIGIIFMEPTENNMLAGPPNKLFNYMRYGLPVVSVDLPETSRIISETQCGLIVKDRNTDSLARALSSLIEDRFKLHQMGSKAKEAVLSYYSWEHMESKLLRIYQELLGG